MTLGERLTALRGQVSRAKAADAIDDRTDQWLSNFELDKLVPTDANLLKIARH